MTETCVVCDGHAELVRGIREVRVGERMVSVEGEYMQCSDCGERYYRAGQMRALQRAAAEIVRTEEGLVTPSDIVRFRERYGLTQATLEKLMNAGPKTVGRWERGTVAPSGPADTLLRELIDSPALVRKVAAQREVLLRDGGRAEIRIFISRPSQPPVKVTPDAPALTLNAGSLDGVLEEYGLLPAGLTGSPHFKPGVQWQQPIH